MAYDIKKHSLNMALNQYLQSWNPDRVDDVLDALLSDDVELFEELGVSLLPSFSDVPLRHIAGYISGAVESNEREIGSAIKQTSSDNSNFVEKVRFLCDAIEEGDPETIANHRNFVSRDLPSLKIDRDYVIGRFTEIAVELGVPYEKGETAGRECFASMARTAEKIAKEGDRDRIKCRIPVVKRPAPEIALVEWLAARSKDVRDISIRNNVRPYVGLYSDLIDLEPINGKGIATVTLSDTHTAAFADIGRNEEMARVLLSAAHKVCTPGWSGDAFLLQDTNGNEVGRFEILPELAATDLKSAAPVRLELNLSAIPSQQDRITTIAEILRDVALQVSQSEGDINFAITGPGNVTLGKLVMESPVKDIEQEASVDHSAPTL